jgi:uncharacterized protein YbaP (TraB family)
MKRFFLLFFFSSCFFSAKLAAQPVSPWPKTLLWRISGNGLPKNSFLFGTMHLQDKRLFYFGDSLYHYLEQAEGYALEIDVQELMDSIIQQAIDQQTDEWVDKKRLTHDNEKKKIIDSLIQNVKDRNDKASKRQLKKLRDEKVRNALKNKEMPTIMDAYLYGIARRQGKWLGGIEDVQDQLSLFDELGDDITDEELLGPDAVIVSSIEQMIRIYLSSDLNAIEKYITQGYSQEQEDKLLLHRNIKMAWRMDSLAHLRSMFFAVGAAHLPGDSGVISLLRQKGYQVDPVFSSAKIDPVQYASTLAEIPWVTVEDDRKTYEVEMPGKASDLVMFDGLIKMKYYTDITTLTYFMSGSTFAQKDVDLTGIMENLSANTEAEIISKKMIERNGARGIESVMLSEDHYYRVQYLFRDNMVYMLIAGGEKKETVEMPEVKRFFESFVAKKSESPQPPKEWSAFGLEEKAFTIMLPGTPRHNEKLEKSAENNEWSFTIYDYADENTGIYYMIKVGDIAPGFYLSGDSSYFSSFRATLEGIIETVTREEKLTAGSFPAFRFEGETKTGNLIYKSLAVSRGNRTYNLIAGGAKSPETERNLENFINSFTLTAYKKPSLKKEWSPGAEFYTVVPAPLLVKEKDTEEGEDEGDEETDTGVIRYISYDPNEVLSYEVYKTPLSPYYWISSDSLFFEQAGAQYKKWNDSVLSRKAVVNGKLRGMEWVIEMPDNNNRKKLRQLLDGDTLYTLISFIPPQYIDETAHRQFFEEFRVVAENLHPTIFKSKAALLLTDLSSADSATFAKASQAFYSASFEKEDRDLLHQALLKDYIDDTLGAYYTIRQRVVDRLQDLADSSTVAFVRENLPLQTGNREKIKFDLLNVLAAYKTGYAYSTLKQLLLTYTPTEKGNAELSYHITDSLELTKGLFPEILTLSNDDLFAGRIISISVDLLDSNLISVDMLRPNRQNFLYTADTTLAGIKRKEPDEAYYSYEYFSLLHLLQHFSDAESNRLLQQYLLLGDLALKQEAAVALLKNGQPVSGKEIEKIAADKAFRRALYDELVRLEKQKLFPGKYLSQQYLAESDVYTYAYDDEEAPEEVKFVGRRDILYKGETKRFYLFRVSYPYNEEDEEANAADHQYLGIAGPYPTDTKKLDTGNEATGLFWKENFDAKKTDQQLADYLKMLEEEVEK